MTSTLRYTILVFVGFVFFGILIYIVLQFNLLSSTQDALVNNNVNVAESLNNTTASEVETPTTGWSDYTLANGLFTFPYPENWTVDVVSENEELHVNENGTYASIKFLIRSYADAPATADDRRGPDITKEDMDAVRALIVSDGERTQGNISFYRTITVDQSSMSVVAFTTFFIGDTYVRVTLPLEPEGVDTLDFDAYQAAQEQLIADLNRGTATGTNQELYIMYQVMIDAIQLGSDEAETAAANSNINAGVINLDTAAANTATDATVTAQDNAFVYRNTTAGVAFTFPATWGYDIYSLQEDGFLAWLNSADPDRGILESETVYPNEAALSVQLLTPSNTDYAKVKGYVTSFTPASSPELGFTPSVVSIERITLGEISGSLYLWEQRLTDTNELLHKQLTAALELADGSMLFLQGAYGAGDSSAQREQELTDIVRSIQAL